ncbi:hypothetical protein ACR776_07355 [Sphingobacterium spiritivorum]|uniref:hypothetical protein n=1 Tax=Sphingobacterium spiritivorum TaxID=258 RepID=UPI003DA5F689
MYSIIDWLKFVLSVMVKYTINKVFAESFSDPIWKIEADSNTRLLAVETRDLESTLPAFHVISFTGTRLLDNFRLKTKEWTLADIQGDYLILKKLGTNTPYAAGITVLHIPSRTITQQWHQYLLIDIFKGLLKVRHHTISSGFEEYISISTGTPLQTTDSEIQYCANHISFPLAYHGSLPHFLQSTVYEDTMWISKIRQRYLWCYHTRKEDKFDLNICISDQYREIHRCCLLEQNSKMIPQPYFQIDDQIFLMTYNKQEIVSYLV